MLICILDIDEKGEIRGWIMAAGFRDAFHRANHAAIGEGKDSKMFQLAQMLRGFAASDFAPKPWQEHVADRSRDAGKLLTWTNDRHDLPPLSHPRPRPPALCAVVCAVWRGGVTTS